MRSEAGRSRPSSSSGDSDPIFPPRVAERIAELIPGALPAETIANAGHFVQEDAGQEAAERIARFLDTDR